MKARVSMIAALGKNRVLGNKNQLLWQISDDLKRFKQLTSGHTVIMGRKTFDSILSYLGKPLPNRTNIVVTRDASWTHDGVIAVPSVESGIEKARELGADEIYIGGGAQIYALALPFADRLYITLIDDEKEGDCYFPEYETEFTKVLSREERVDEKTGLHYTWLDLER